LFNIDKLPGLHDPFAGGGTIPIEAQRLGLEAYANPGWKNEKTLIDHDWPGSTGLAADVRYYGQWMRDQAFKRIGHLYPQIEITSSMIDERPDLKDYKDQKLTIVAWLWARTVKSPSPAFSHVHVPLASTFILGNKPGKESFVTPIIENDSYRLVVVVGKPTVEAKAGTTAGKRQAFRCLMSNVPIGYDSIRNEGKSKRLGQKLLGIVAEGKKGRVYLSPSPEMELLAESAKPSWAPDSVMPTKHRNFQPPAYGMENMGDPFTPRQLVALTTFSDMVLEAQEVIRNDAKDVGFVDEGTSLAEGGTGTRAYSEAVSTYLAFAQSKACNRNTSLCICES